MTDRDHFACAALTGLLLDGDETQCPASHIAECAYKLADAMLRERERTNHDAAPAATARTDAAAGEPGGSMGTGNTQEPVAWAVAIGQEGYVLDDIFVCERKAAAAWKWRNNNDTCGARIIPLYRQPQPSLTAEEREAIGVAMHRCDGPEFKTLRALLERLE